MIFFFFFLISGNLQTDWENISKDTCQWDILITQLQDLALLNAILSITLKNLIKTKSMAEIPFDFEYQSLNSIQSNGTGRVSELVTKWLAQFGFDPSVYINKNDVEYSNEGMAEIKNSDSFKSLLVEELNKANNIARENKENLNLILRMFVVNTSFDIVHCCF